MVMLGDGEHKVEIQNSIEKLGLSDKVILKGVVHDVEKYIFKSNMYIHSAYYEPFGLVFLEVMAAGLPIITLDGKGNRDLIENGQNGYLIETQYPVEFADKIIQLWNDQQRYDEMSDYCIDYAKSFDLSIKTKELVTFYKEILTQNETRI